MTSAEATECPYCRGGIKAGAVVCKHCGSRLRDAAPTHGGMCPFCKESINEAAVKCKHCGSGVGAAPAHLRPLGSPPYSSALTARNGLGGGELMVVPPEYGVAWGCIWRCDCIRESELFPGICNEWHCYPIYC